MKNTIGAILIVLGLFGLAVRLYGSHPIRRASFRTWDIQSQWTRACGVVFLRNTPAVSEFPRPVAWRPERNPASWQVKRPVLMDRGHHRESQDGASVYNSVLDVEIAFKLRSVFSALVSARTTLCRRNGFRTDRDSRAQSGRGKA